MYHRIWPNLHDRITQTPQQLEEQFTYLKSEGYETLSLSHYIQLCRGKTPVAKKYILITFDDGYQNNLTYAYPLLKKFGFTATFFIIGDSLEGNIQAENPLDRKMNVEELRLLDPQIVQLAMHGFHHENFKTTPVPVIKEAIQKTITIFQSDGIELHRSIAYPYGGRPKEKATFDELKNWMREQSIEAAFRIGNSISEIPAKDIYEIKRIDIRGTDSFEDFKIKLKKGKLNPF
ncbi:MAG TPA: polysaccharide deacetylase family protein [Flavipsychrobacter sp.]|nr:polysaccharide deacetylase family protein [Flavipsychrobacter sp.]